MKFTYIPDVEYSYFVPRDFPDSEYFHDHKHMKQAMITDMTMHRITRSRLYDAIVFSSMQVSR